MSQKVFCSVPSSFSGFTGVGGAGVWCILRIGLRQGEHKTQTAKSCNVDQSHIGKKMHYVQSNINACVPNG